VLSDPHKDISEVDIDYWRHRVVSLEALVCELLTKNQAMRFLLEARTPEQLSIRPSEALDVCESTLGSFSYPLV